MRRCLSAPASSWIVPAFRCALDCCSIFLILRERREGHGTDYRCDYSVESCKLEVHRTCMDCVITIEIVTTLELIRAGNVHWKIWIFIVQGGSDLSHFLLTVVVAVTWQRANERPNCVCSLCATWLKTALRTLTLLIAFVIHCFPALWRMIAIVHAPIVWGWPGCQVNEIVATGGSTRRKLLGNPLSRRLQIATRHEYVCSDAAQDRCELFNVGTRRQQAWSVRAVSWCRFPHRLYMWRWTFSVSATCVTVSNPDLLSGIKAGVGPASRSWKMTYRNEVNVRKPLELCV